MIALIDGLIALGLVVGLLVLLVAAIPLVVIWCVTNHVEWLPVALLLGLLLRRPVLRLLRWLSR